MSDLHLLDLRVQFPRCLVRSGLHRREVRSRVLSAAEAKGLYHQESQVCGVRSRKCSSHLLQLRLRTVDFRRDADFTVRHDSVRAPSQAPEAGQHTS